MCQCHPPPPTLISGPATEALTVYEVKEARDAIQLRA